MTEEQTKDLVEFIRANLKLKVGGDQNGMVWIQLVLINPLTKEREVISEEII